jgi:hypothetical protein
MNYKFDKKEHLHFLDDVALTGTSSVMDVLGKPLSWWASGKAVETLGWIHPDIKENGLVVGKRTQEERIRAVTETLRAIKIMTADAFVKLLDRAYKAHSVSLKDSAQKGTDLHAELESYVKSKMGKNDKKQFDPKIQPFIDWAENNVEKFIWSECHCFSKDMWVGGITDAGAVLKDGSVAVIDFKSSKEAYPSQFIQAAGYAMQLEENGLWNEAGTANKKLENKIDTLIVVPFGATKVLPVIRKNVEDYKKGFLSALQLYRLLGLSK